jgi:FlaG/FlaF family flagellin (archaellin)
MCCKGNGKRDDAVSELVGEMLMLTIVLIMMAVFASSASDVLPPARDPSVTILPPHGTPVILYHKGGDAIPISDIRVIVNEVEIDRGKWELYDEEGIKIEDTDGLFDLGGYIKISNPSDAGIGDRIRLATSRAVIFSGEVT